MPQKRSLDEVFASFAETWSPRIVAQVNDYAVKIARVEGDFDEHVHADTDEFFLVLAGELRLGLPGGAVTLGPGEVYTVPRGTPHRPSAAPGTRILMFEPQGTYNTGDPATGTAGVTLGER